MCITGNSATFAIQGLPLAEAVVEIGERSTSVAVINDEDLASVVAKKCKGDITDHGSLDVSFRYAKEDWTKLAAGVEGTGIYTTSDSSIHQGEGFIATETLTAAQNNQRHLTRIMWQWKDAVTFTPGGAQQASTQTGWELQQLEGYRAGFGGQLFATVVDRIWWHDGQLRHHAGVVHRQPGSIIFLDYPPATTSEADLTALKALVAERDQARAATMQIEAPAGNFLRLPPEFLRQMQLIA